MGTIDITRSYRDGDILFEADLDNIKTAAETLVNTDGLDNDNIQDSGITASTKLIDGTITAAKIASSAITTAKIADDAITTAKIADDAVTGDKIAADAVTTVKLGGLGADKIATGPFLAETTRDTTSSQTVLSDNVFVEINYVTTQTTHTITSNGRLTLVKLNLHPFSPFTSFGLANPSYTYVRVKANGSIVSAWTLFVAAGESASILSDYTDSFYFFHTPSAGSVIYTVEIGGSNASSSSQTLSVNPVSISCLEI